MGADYTAVEHEWLQIRKARMKKDFDKE